MPDVTARMWCEKKYMSRHGVFVLCNEILFHGVRAITNLTGYKDIDILSPTVLLESEG